MNAIFLLYECMIASKNEEHNIISNETLFGMIELIM